MWARSRLSFGVRSVKIALLPAHSIFNISVCELELEQAVSDVILSRLTMPSALPLDAGRFMGYCQVKSEPSGLSSLNVLLTKSQGERVKKGGSQRGGKTKMDGLVVSIRRAW